ncbi:hypothetical protein [Streptomyces sp. enrichment culture]|uniref:hypothetical protein n=1 Tax=Streptomyces sp. enrichment culture TaxID=1795815 RepID=UPI003F550BC7
MSQERRKLPLIAVYGEAAAKAEQRVTELLDAAGASPTEVHTLVAAIQVDAVEAAQGEVIELDTQAPSGSSDRPTKAGIALSGRSPTGSPTSPTAGPNGGLRAGHAAGRIEVGTGLPAHASRQRGGGPGAPGARCS